MKLRTFIDILEVKDFHGDDSVDISAIVTHSAQASSHTLFVAIPGAAADGHAFLTDAYRAGARVFLTQKPFRMPGVTNIVVADTHAALAVLAARLYDNPSGSLKLIGITGTNGKTTTAFLLESILQASGIPTGLISTVTYRFGGTGMDADRTTPDHLGLQRMLRDMADAGMQYVVMEVSSHGLQQRRVDGCHFDAAIFTNLTPEHLDYHGSMDEYYRSKERFFSEVLPASRKPHTVAIINRDDPRAQVLQSRIRGRAISYGIKEGDVYASSARITLEGIMADLVTPGGIFPVASRLVGFFNLSNILAAVAAATFFEISPEAIRQGIARMTGVPGRMERIENSRGILVFVDYAHTGDALGQVLGMLKKTGARRIITVFGCGGDRDRTKRPVMGSVAAQHSAVVILTSDNPRSEDPHRIIKEIESGVLQQAFTRVAADNVGTGQERLYLVQPDRRAAIRTGIGLARAGDVVLIAGKGHETYQQTGSEKKHFDDREEARQALALCA